MTLQFASSDNPEHAAGTPETFRYTPLVDRRTQHHPLSATIDNHLLSATIDKRRLPEPTEGPSSMLLPCVAVGEQDSAADG